MCPVIAGPRRSVNDNHAILGVDMIIWTGECDGTLLYRTLGSNGAVDVNLRPTGTYVLDRREIAHNKGTCDTDCTSPTIGASAAKLCRDISMAGYSVGTTVSDKSKRPFLIDFDSDHILCYDIESEFDGGAYCHYNSPMLCVTLVCSCGSCVYPDARWGGNP